MSTVNTTNLIGRWSMDGAMEDMAARFRSPVDILHALSSGASEPAPAAEHGVANTSLWMKPAGEDDWQPLPA